jgi:CheY-like chemotaxis protein
MVGDRDAALAAGFDGYLAKPIDPLTLAPAIDGFLPPHLRAGTHRREATTGGRG